MKAYSYTFRESKRYLVVLITTFLGMILLLSQSRIGWGDGSTWTMPYNSLNQSTAAALFTLTQTGTGRAGYFQINNATNNEIALFSQSNGGGIALYALMTGTGQGGYFRITNTGNNQPALQAVTTGIGRAGHFQISNANNSEAALFSQSSGRGFALYALMTGTGWAGYIQINNVSNSRPALQAVTNGTGQAGFFQISNANNGNPALQAQTNGSGFAIYGYTTGTGQAGYFQINNVSNSRPALQAITNGTGQAGFFQINNASSSNYALQALTFGSGAAIYGYTTGTGQAGLFRVNNASNSAAALQALTNGTGSAISASTNGTGQAGVFQIANAGNNNDALQAQTNGGGSAVAATTTGGGQAGYFRVNNANNGSAALLAETNGFGAAISGIGYDGVIGEAVGLGGAGVLGVANEGETSYGVWGQSLTGFAGYFTGKVEISEDLNVSGTKNFKIDHPLDPANKYLIHSCIESAERLNVYSGNVLLDANGEAWVELPEWFEAVNTDFRYQLTCIGGYAQVYIAQEIQNGRFKIAGGRPDMKISWQVTGVRSDPYAQAHPFQVEREKSDYERGFYLHPELYGQPDSLRMENAHRRPRSNSKQGK